MKTPSSALKKRISHDKTDFSTLPLGQRRAALALIGGSSARTYPEASEVAGISLGTLHTHLRRIRHRHPDLYAAIRKVRLGQLKVRHNLALASARAHSRAWFRRVGRFERRWLGISMFG